METLDTNLHIYTATQLYSSMVQASWLQLLGPRDSLPRVHLYLLLVRYHFSSCVRCALLPPAHGGGFGSASKSPSLLWDQDSRGDLPPVGVLCDANMSRVLARL